MSSLGVASRLSRTATIARPTARRILLKQREGRAAASLPTGYRYDLVNISRWAYVMVLILPRIAAHCPVPRAGSSKTPPPLPPQLQPPSQPLNPPPHRPHHLKRSPERRMTTKPARSSSNGTTARFPGFTIGGCSIIVGVKGVSMRSRSRGGKGCWRWVFPIYVPPSISL